jgi:hypothetical protein
MSAELNKNLIRYGLLIAAMPIWWPFVKTLWRDFNSALREEGGLFGTPPSGRELEEIRREKAKEPEQLVSEPWVKAGDLRSTRMRTPSNKAPKSAAPERRFRQATNKKPGGPGPGRRFR